MVKFEKGIVRRYVIFFVGLFVMSLGIACITNASLGTSPITSIPYSLSMVFPSLSLGNFTILYSLLLVFLQFVMLGKKANKFNLFEQVIVSIFFGYFVDIGRFILADLNPSEYWLSLVCVVLGCCGLAFGVYIQIVSNLVIVPGDGFAYTLTMKLRKPYNRVRVTSDMTMVVIAAIIGLIGLGTLGGVREGTIISALLVGNIANQFIRHLDRLTDALIPGRSATIHISRNKGKDLTEEIEKKDASL